jgi:hypothetical protein
MSQKSGTPISSEILRRIGNALVVARRESTQSNWTKSDMKYLKEDTADSYDRTVRRQGNKSSAPAKVHTGYLSMKPLGAAWSLRTCPCRVKLDEHSR